MAKKRLILALTTSVFLSFTLACDRLFNLAGPSSITNSGFSTLPDWSPCVVIHTPGFNGAPELEKQMQLAGELKQAGRLTWVRFGGSFVNGDGLDYFHRARTMGFKIFGIIGLQDLEIYGWENAFDSIYRQYPADIWEIAGEISTGGGGAPGDNPLMTPEVFMLKFKRLYEHVRKNYPGVVLTSPPTFGSGSIGAVELERFLELGMLEMDIIIAVNVYSDHALSRYAAVFAKYGSQLANKRIWVTETGAYGPELQVDWVENFYPRLVNTFHPEMICWYALWVGDQEGGDNPFGLVTNINNGQPLVKRPLFKKLVGEE